MRQVCVTGIGVVSPIGVGIDAFKSSLRNGVSGIRTMKRQDPSLPLRVAGQVDIDFSRHLPAATISSLDRFSLFALVAARQAVEDANRTGTPLPLDDAGVYLGTGTGGIGAMEVGYEEFFLRGGRRMRPLTVVQAMSNAATAHVAMEYGCHGPAMTYSTACSSSPTAIGEAYRAIKHGYVDRAIAGGTEATLVPSVMKAWEAMRTLALPDSANPAASCKPFAKGRTGLVMSEGSAIVVLEELDHALRRGAAVYALLGGYGSYTDATHITKPDARGQAGAMQAALRDAGLTPEKIDYINAHGTATITGDVIETNAIKAVFGARASQIPVTSTKSMHGHVMGATGAVEFIASLIALGEGFIPPTINLSERDVECDLDYVPNEARQGVTLNHIMSNSFAFGGSNAVLIASRY